MAIRPRDKNGLLLSLSGYKKLKAFHSGGYFWDPLPQSLIRQFLGDFLPPVEVTQEHGETVGWFRRFINAKEVLYKSKPFGGRAIPECQLNQIRSQLTLLQSAVAAHDTQQHNRELISRFRLPHPEKDPELYRIRGPLWDRHLEILWGCEKVEDTSVAPSDALGLLRPDHFYKLKRWLCWLLAALLAFFLLWGIWCLISGTYVRAVNKAPLTMGVVRTENLKQRIVSIDGLQNSSDTDGAVVDNIIDWGDGTKETIPARIPKASKAYGQDGDYQVGLRAVDNLGKESAPQAFLIKLDYEQKARVLEAEQKRIEAAERAAELEARKRAAEDVARAETEKLIIEEAAKKARIDAEVEMRKRLADEAKKAEAAKEAEASKLEAARKAAEIDALEKQAAAAQKESDERSNNLAQGNAGSKSGGANSPKGPGEFKDVTTGRPVRPISFEKPSYPRRALTSYQEGSVQVQFTVDKNGKTKDLQVINDVNGDYFKASVLDSIRKATFQPMLIDGVPVEHIIGYEIKFTINKD